MRDQPISLFLEFREFDHGCFCHGSAPWPHSTENGENAMLPKANIQSPMRHSPNSAAANGFHSNDDSHASFDLRDTLAATVVRELSFAEFRAALEKSGKRFA
ncbi:MAG: hypothetical protein IPN75_17185 [Dechloromonas sp.]|uniref:Uncharacterized protein n=1 Tax=Candidatus Dechloromonas phosphorivorans TaxID=2899244 RepID=A0A9D7LTJ6_9RHOO|nr:hypothetical protein [Candidatus Dechloromonas phosphorivorans]